MGYRCRPDHDIDHSPRDTNTNTKSASPGAPRDAPEVVAEPEELEDGVVIYGQRTDVCTPLEGLLRLVVVPVVQEA